MNNLYEGIAIFFAVISGVILFYIQVSKKLFFLWQSDNLFSELTSTDKKLLFLCLVSFAFCLIFLALSF